MGDAPHDEPLVLVDGSSYLYRAYHALPPLTNHQGEPTGAVYGVVNMLHKLLTEECGERVGVVFDAPGRTFRDDLFDQYKAHRPPMPDDLRAQRGPLKAIIEAMGVPVLEVEGVEADDVIGTLAARYPGPVVISTTDKDMAQLVNGRVTLLNTMSGTRLNPDGVREKFGVPPEAIRDYLALVGDTSDNIPGVPKVGPKTAVKWLSQYGSLDAIRAHADEIGGKVGESLREHLDHLPLSHDLATIRCDVPLESRPEDLRRGAPDRERLEDLYRRYDLRRFLRELRDEAPEATTGGGSNPGRGKKGAEGDYQPVVTEEALAEWRQRLEAAALFSVDLETDSLDYMEARIVGVALAVEPGAGAYIPVGHNGPDAPDQLPLERVLDTLRPVLEDPERPKVGQNLKYDMSVFATHQVALCGIRYDTMLESYVLNSTATRHDMDSLADQYLGVETIRYEDVCGKGARQISFAQVDLETAVRYAAEDADITLRLHRELYPRLEREPPLHRVFTELEMPLIPVLSRMERHGVRVDTSLLAEQSKELARRMEEVEAEAHREAGGPFNLGSPKQIQEILFDRMGLPVVQKTPKGQPSTAESVLEELAVQGHALPALILQHRTLSKLRSTYTDKLPRLVRPDTGRVHTSYHQAVTATGRLSSSDPNLQNIPVRTAEGRRIRRAFVAEPGCRLLSADYSQVELRIMAHLSGDEGLLAAFAEERDIHRATAAEVFGVPENELTDEQRRAAKAINFGLIYGMSAFGLARQLGVPRESAQLYIDRYFERYPGVRKYMDKTREEARERGYVETVHGRRLYVPEIQSRNRQRREYAERTAINAPMQGTAADLIKRAMIDIDAWLCEEHSDTRMVMQVHDELVLEVPEGVVDAVADGVRTRMAAAGSLAVPLVVDVGVGAHWDEAH